MKKVSRSEFLEQFSVVWSMRYDLPDVMLEDVREIRQELKGMNQDDDYSALAELVNDFLRGAAERGPDEKLPAERDAFVSHLRGNAPGADGLFEGEAGEEFGAPEIATASTGSVEQGRSNRIKQ